MPFIHRVFKICPENKNGFLEWEKTCLNSANRDIIKEIVMVPDPITIVTVPDPITRSLSP